MNVLHRDGAGQPDLQASHPGWGQACMCDPGTETRSPESPRQQEILTTAHLWVPTWDARGHEDSGGAQKRSGTSRVGQMRVPAWPGSGPLVETSLF